MNTTPRLRPDLRATPLQDEEGVVYVDVVDPRAGRALRLYAFEWKIAELMDGERSFDELADWARTEFDWVVSQDDLQAYAARLGEFGLLSGEWNGMMQAELAAAGVEPTKRVEQLPELPPQQEQLRPSPPRPFREESQSGVDISIDMSEPAMPAEPARPMWVPPAADVSTRRAVVTPESVPAESLPEPPMPPVRQPAAASLGRSEAPAAVAAKPSAHDQWTAPSLATPDELAPPRRGTNRILLIALGLVVVLGGGFLVWQNFFAEAGTVAVTSVLVQSVPAPANARLYFSVSGKTESSEALTITFARVGTVVSAVTPGTAVKAGDPLVTLDGYAAIAKQIADVRDREKYYLGKNDERKVAEKRRIIANLEERAKATQLLAPATAMIADVSVHPGDAVKVGDVAVKLADTRLTATFPLPSDEAAELRVGQEAQVLLPDGSVVAAQIASVGGTGVKLAPFEAKGLRPGSELRLVRKQIDDVIRIPAAALSKGPEGDRVFVNEGGVARARPVVVAGRDGDSVLVGKGLKPGDQLITRPNTLTNGQKVTTGAAQ